MWASQREAVEGRGYEAALPDLPGPEAARSLGEWSERLLRLFDGPFVPVGSSMGGYLAFDLWRRACDRIEALVLVDTRAAADTDETRRARDENIRVLEEDGVPELWERLQPKLFSLNAAPEVVCSAREIALEQGATRLAAALAAIRDRLDSTPLLPHIHVPVLVVTGEQDALIPPTESEALADALPSARLVRIAGAGHLPPLERPDEFNAALLSFLDELALAD